jgi:hypothetical protein
LKTLELVDWLLRVTLSGEVVTEEFSEGENLLNASDAFKYEASTTPEEANLVAGNVKPDLSLLSLMLLTMVGYAASLDDAADSRFDSESTVCILAESGLLVAERSNFCRDKGEGDVRESSCALVEAAFKPRFDSKKVLKLAESSSVEANEFPRDEADAKLCCFLSPYEDVVKKSSSLANVVFRE